MSQGQLTLPKRLREELGIGCNENVLFIREDDGMVTLRNQHLEAVQAREELAMEEQRRLQASEFDEALIVLMRHRFGEEVPPEELARAREVYEGFTGEQGQGRGLAAI